MSDQDQEEIKRLRGLECSEMYSNLISWIPLNQDISNAEFGKIKERFPAAVDQMYEQMDYIDKAWIAYRDGKATKEAYRDQLKNLFTIISQMCAEYKKELPNWMLRNKVSHS